MPNLGHTMDKHRKWQQSQESLIAASLAVPGLLLWTSQDPSCIFHYETKAHSAFANDSSKFYESLEITGKKGLLLSGRNEVV